MFIISNVVRTNNVVNIIIGLAFIFSLIVCYYFRKQLLDKEVLISRYEDYVFDFVKKRSITVDDTPKLVSFISKNTSDSDVKLIYRYFNKECFKCVVSDIHLIRCWQSKLGKRNILVFPNAPKDRNSKIVLESTLNGIIYYPVNEKDFAIDYLNEKEYRYFALVDSSGHLSNIFMPQAIFPELTEKYFEFILPILENGKTN